MPQGVFDDIRPNTYRFVATWSAQPLMAGWESQARQRRHPQRNSARVSCASHCSWWPGSCLAPKFFRQIAFFYFSLSKTVCLLGSVAVGDDFSSVHTAPWSAISWRSEPGTPMPFVKAKPQWLLPVRRLSLATSQRCGRRLLALALAQPPSLHRTQPSRGRHDQVTPSFLAVSDAGGIDAD